MAIAELFAAVIIANPNINYVPMNESCRYNIDDEALYCTMLESVPSGKMNYNVKFKGIKLRVNNNRLYFKNTLSYYDYKHNRS